MIVVRSHGGYGDLGQYTLRIYEGSVLVPNTNPITLPPLIDVVCDPYLPVTLKTASQLGLSSNVTPQTSLSRVKLDASGPVTTSTGTTEDAAALALGELYAALR